MATTMNRISENNINSVSKNMTFLASMGSVAPFIGLFGTVWGIMNSFRSIAITQNTSLATVAPGVAEALLATAMGLIVAIPAWMSYNKLADVLQSYSDNAQQLISDFVASTDRLAQED